MVRLPVGDDLRRAHRAGFVWPLPGDLDDEVLEQRLFPPPPTWIAEGRPMPDWPTIARELRRKGVTFRLVWETYRTEHPDGFGYSCYVAARLMWRQPGSGLVPLA